MVSLVNSHANSTRIGWHLWEIDLRFTPWVTSRVAGRRNLSESPIQVEAGKGLSRTRDPSFRALSGRLKFTVRRHKFNKDSLSSAPEVDVPDAEALGLRHGSRALPQRDAVGLPERVCVRERVCV